jgi:hypothetical protein
VDAENSAATKVSRRSDFGIRSLRYSRMALILSLKNRESRCAEANDLQNVTASCDMALN